MKPLLSLLVFVLFTLSVGAQTFTGSNGNIPDNGTPVTFTANVTGLPAALDSSFGLINVCLNIIHPYDSDLDIWLIAPDSTFIELSTGNGGSGDNYWNTCFYDTVSTLISNATAPFTGSFQPEGLLYIANNGQDPNGTWKLLIHDTYPFADAGILLNWTLTFGNNPPQGFVLQSSNLPIIKINTFGQTIPDEPKITVAMQIINNGPGIRNYSTDPANEYNGLIGIEIRGSSSQMFPKKSYGFETLDSTGTEADFPLLGMPAESDWILSANYTDKSFLRNVIMYDRARAMGMYATRTQFCELILNGQYLGIYVFTEKIKRDHGRVDIAKMTPADTSGDDLTGGYILKIDKTTGGTGAGWLSGYPPPGGGPIPLIQYEYPSENNILPVQAQYIEQYCDSFENALHGTSFTNPVTGYRAYVDLSSWVDYFLLSELSKNVDGYRISTFFHKAKDSDGGRLRMGPVWDYDIACGNADYHNGNIASGFLYQNIFPSSPQQPPFWWTRLMQDPYFVNTVRCRWEELRDSVLSTATLHSWIDSVALLLNESQVRNFTTWPILGVYVWPNPSPIPPDYAGVVQELKNWMTNRTNWLDINLPGICSLAGIKDVAVSSTVTAYPNPATTETTVLLPEVRNEGGVLRIYNQLGQLQRAEKITVNGKRISVDLRGISDGLLIIEIVLKDGSQRTLLLKQQ